MSATRSLKRHLIAGLVVIAPVTITGFVLWWIFQRLDGLLGNIIYPAIGVAVPGLGLLLLLLLLLTAGWAAERAIGARAVAAWHAFLERFPLTRRLYSASNRIVRTVLGEEKRFFREVVVIEYPSPGRWSLGFVTAPTPEPLHPGPGGDFVTIFIPTTPNPTTGFLVLVASDQVRKVALTVEEAFTFILSAGAVAPDVIPPARLPAPPAERAS